MAKDLGIFGPFVTQGLNLGLDVLTNAIPGGSKGREVACDAGELASRMGLEIFPKLRDGRLTNEERDAILAKFQENVPIETWTIAVAALKSGLDRVIGGIR